MEAAKSQSKKLKLGEEYKSKKPKVESNEDSDDLGISNDIKGILSAISAFKDRAAVDVKQKSESIAESLSNEIKSLLDDAKKRAEKERDGVLKTLAKVHKDFEIRLKEQLDKFQTQREAYLKISKGHMQCCQDIMSQFDDQKEKLLLQGDEMRKKDKQSLEKLQKLCQEKLEDAESRLKKRKEEEKSVIYLKKTLNSFFNDESSQDIAEF